MMRGVRPPSARVKNAAAFALASALAACLAQTAGARGRQNDPAAPRAERVEPPEGFRRAAGTPADAPVAFEFKSGGFSYRVAANGNGQRTKGDKTRRYNLHLGSGEAIRRLYFSEYDDDLLLLCELEGGRDGASAFVTRLEQPSMRALWKQSAPSAEVDALRRGDSLYLAGAGFVGRLELKDGRYAWRHRDRREDVGEAGDEGEGEAAGGKAEVLIPSGRYALAEVAGDAVTFKLTRGAENPRPKTLRVDRKTGRILGVE